jgi:hypothetical protein
VANQGDYDLLLVGLEIYFEGTILGKVIGFTTRIINPDRLIDKFTGKKAYLKILLLMKEPDKSLLKQNATRDFDRQRVSGYRSSIYTIFKSDDSFLIDYAQKLIYNNNSKITILDVKGHARIILSFKVL